MSGMDVVLVTDWLFGGRLKDSSAAQPGFDDSGFERVTVPHCVVPLSWRDWEPSTWEDVWIYRRHLDLPEGFRDQRVFLDFSGVLSAATVWLNGVELGAHRGGYLPFGFEVTGQLAERDNVLAVVVDSRWLPVPPSGHPDGSAGVDYMQPGGIYRAVSLRAVPQVYVADVFARPVAVLDPSRRRVEVEYTLDAAAAVAAADVEVVVELRSAQGALVASEASAVEVSGAGLVTRRATLSSLGDVALWDVSSPNLYEVVVSLRAGGASAHSYTTRIGFREARFEDDGFYLNGRRVQLFGVNRHQIYPYTGMAMPDRVQRRDAEILRDEFNCTIVRCAHYPQAAAFLDACDELGMLVYEEIPGWQYVGDADWQALVMRDVGDMIRRDRNRPSVVTWGVRINESDNWPELYSRTDALAKQLDPSRQTSGAMRGDLHSTEDYAHDLFAYNDYRHSSLGADLRPPLPGIPYLVTEAIGSLAGPSFYRRTDTQAVQGRQAYLHAQVHSQAGASERYAGVVAWQAFDYDSENGRIDHRLKCNGIGDTFRVPKLGAAIYRAQVSPRVRAVIEPAFYWDFGLSAAADWSEAMVCSNCERLDVFVGGELRARVTPDAERFGGMAYPPSFVDLGLSEADRAGLPELRIDGYVGAELVVSRRYASDPALDRLSVVADDDVLVSDGVDATRVVFRSVDRFGAPRPYVGGSVALSLSGPGSLVGDNPFGFGDHGGVGAVWVRTVAGADGRIELTATHAGLGSGTVSIVSRRP